MYRAVRRLGRHKQRQSNLTPYVTATVDLVPELVEPTTDLYESWRAARDEWGPGRHEDGFDLRPGDDTHTAEGFAAWVARLRRSPALSWWIVENNAMGIAPSVERVRKRLDVGCAPPVAWREELTAVPP